MLSSSEMSVGPKIVDNPAVLFCWKCVNCSFNSSFALVRAFQNICKNQSNFHYLIICHKFFWCNILKSLYCIYIGIYIVYYILILINHFDVPSWEFLLYRILSRERHLFHSRHFHLHCADAMAKQKVLHQLSFIYKYVDFIFIKISKNYFSIIFKIKLKNIYIK